MLSFIVLLLMVSTSTVASDDVVLDLSGGMFNVSVLKNDSLDNYPNLTAVTTLNLSGNAIEEITEDAFIKFSFLENLDLSNNRITSLNSNPFESLWNLKILDLSYNMLTRLQSDLIQNKAHLISINFEHNNISEVEPGFVNEEHRNLNSVNLRYNSLETLTPWPYLIHKSGNKELDQHFYLEHNHISDFVNPFNWTYNLEFPHTRLVYLQHNQLRSLSAESLLTFMKSVTEENLFNAFITLRLFATENPYYCDCHVYKMSVLIRASLFKWTDYEDFLYLCDGPAPLKGQDFLRLTPLSELICPVSLDCPSRCYCEDRRYEETMFVNCTSAQLSEMPLSLPYSKFNRYTLILDNNDISELSVREYTSKIVNVSMVNNKINDLPVNFVMNTSLLEHMDLRDNNIKELPKEIQRLQYGNVELAGNPLQCTCESVWLPEWIHISRVQGNLDLQCIDDSGSSVTVSEITETSLGCNVAQYVPIFIVVGVLLVLIVIIVLFVYRCPYETKVIIFRLFRDRFINKNPLTDYKYNLYWSFDHEHKDVRQWVTQIVDARLAHQVKVFHSFNPLIDYQQTEGNDALGEYADAMDKSCRLAIVLTPGSFKPDTRQEYEIQHACYHHSEKILFIIYNKESKAKMKEKMQEEPWKTRLASARVIDPDARLFYSKLRYELQNIHKKSAEP